MSVLVKVFMRMCTPAPMPDWRDVWIASLRKAGNHQRSNGGLSDLEICADGCGRPCPPVKPWLCEQCHQARLENVNRER